MTLDIKRVVDYLCDKFYTTDPFELARSLNIKILKTDLGEVNGYYLKLFGSKYIVLNNALNYYTLKFVCSHELGHAILHKEDNTIFMKHKTYMNIASYEREADTFAIHLLKKNWDIEQFQRVLEYEDRLWKLIK